MRHTDGTEHTLLAVNGALIVMGLATAGLIFVWTTLRPKAWA